jgi:hypothetical protein
MPLGSKGGEENLRTEEGQGKFVKTFKAKRAGALSTGPSVGSGILMAL